MKKKLLRIENLPKLSLLVILIAYVYTIGTLQFWTVNDDGRRGVIKWDVISYYAYLPATVVHGDPSLSFIGEGKIKNDNKFWYSKLENGNRLIITSMGLSYMYAPFFLVAHALAPVLDQPADGFSNIYQLMLIISGLFYSFAGLLLLYRFLKQHFDPLITAITLVVIGLGTNLLYYSTQEAAMPHSHNFFLVTLFLHMVVRWYKKPTWYNALLFGGLFGFIALVRPTNILLFLFFFLYGVTSWKKLGERILFFTGKWPMVLLMLAAFLVPWIPQFLYWKMITGHYLYFTYAEKNASFFWAHPHILKSLFSFRKGWLIYTPVMWFALAGLVLLFRKRREWFFALTIYVAAMIYVQSCWWCWWFGGGFSLRPYVSMYPLLAFPMAYLLSEIRKERQVAWFISAASFILLLTVYQMFQTKQFRLNAIHYSGTTARSYCENFLRAKPSSASWKMLELPDFNLARLGIYVEYPTSDDPEEWRSMEKEEAFERIRQEIEEDKKVGRQIERYADREHIPVDSAYQVVLQRMYERKAKL